MAKVVWLFRLYQVVAQLKTKKSAKNGFFYYCSCSNVADNILRDFCSSSWNIFCVFFIG